MGTISRWILCGFFLTLVGFAFAAEGNAPKAEAAVKTGTTVVVFDFQGRGKELEECGALLADLTRTQLSGKNTFRLVTREEMNKILDEHKLKISGLTDESAPSAGKMLGAQVIVMGRLFEIGGKITVTAKVIGVETSRVFSQKADGAKDALDKIGETLGNAVADTIQKQSAELITASAPKTDPVEELKAKLKDKKLPRVFVHMREEIIGVRVPDPAAQTEVQLLLTQAGFEVVKDKEGALSSWADKYRAEGGKSAPPKSESVDIVLIGEGISQSAGRTGELTACRARVELEAINIVNGKLLVSDRETGSAVDLAEQVAAKTVLQHTTAKLAPRVILEAVAKWTAAK